MKTVMISCTGAHYPKEAILYAVFFYVRYSVSYRDQEEMMCQHFYGHKIMQLLATFRNQQVTYNY